ncbi:MAG: molybdopterin-guanine dinucleotide biosynthesis protein B [Anaerolineales bacterium]|nr:molybdopterin-guanine dinucleotide biosynthesis protein B [Anaerolineales bacterium]
MDIPIVSIIGRSGVGKTTFLTLLIAEFKKRGFKLAVIKHSNPLHAGHGQVDIDQPGKDTWRHFQSGADAVILAAPNRIGMIQRISNDPSPIDLVGLLMEKPDIIFTEGYKRAGLPSIEIVRAARSNELVSDPAHLIGLVTDVGNLSPVKSDNEITRFSLTDASGVADLIIRRFSLQPGMNNR